MKKLEYLYQNLSSDEIKIVEKTLNNSDLLKNIYQFICQNEITPSAQKDFLDNHHLTNNSFNYLVIYFVSYVANDQQKSKIQYYSHYRKVRDPKYYQKIIQKILDETDIHQKKVLLQKYSEVYSINALNFGEETNQQEEIKKINMLYRESLPETKQKHGKSKNSMSKEKYLRLVHSEMEAIDQKLNMDNYYITCDLRNALDLIQSLVNYMTPKELKPYRDGIKKYYAIVAEKVLKVAGKDPEHFSIVDYYAITNINPIRLFRTANQMNSSLVLQIISKLASHKERQNGLAPMMINESYFADVVQYTYCDTTISKEQMLMIYHNMDPRIPKNEFIFMEFVKDYIRKNKDQLLNEKKLIK